MELTYQKNGDYYIPNIMMDKQEELMLNKYGRMRKNYLKEHKKGVYSGLLLSGRLTEHLQMTQNTAEERMELIISQMAKAEGVTEELKASDPMKWTQLMNSLHQSAEEIVLQEIIFS
ncbi:MAG: TnpV protein [Anaerotignum sp.]|nr:TnpV protein [Anaerotignum sp.]